VSDDDPAAPKIAAEIYSENIHGNGEVRVANNDKAFSILDFCDGIKFLIFSFSHGNEIYKGGPMAELFLSFGFQSKDCYQSLILYVQNKPMHSRKGERSISMYAFLCKNRVKLGYISLSSKTSMSIGLSIHLLRTCDLSELTSVYFDEVSCKYQSSDEAISYAIAAGVPRDALEELHSPVMPWDWRFDEEIVADLLAEKAPSLIKMEVSLSQQAWDWPLPLANLSNRLEELHFELYWENSCDRELGDFNQLLENVEYMSKLKRIKFDIPSWARRTSVSGFRIKSQTLEAIDVMACGNGVYFDECVCPSLQVFVNGWVSIDDLGSGGGVKPVTPFTREDMIVPDHHVEMKAPGHIKRFVDFKVGNRPFVGMDVPDSCIVRVVVSFSEYYV